jgi:hypothetical protein
MSEPSVKPDRQRSSVAASKRELPQRPYSVAEFCNKITGNGAYGKPLASISRTSSSVG